MVVAINEHASRHSNYVLALSMRCGRSCFERCNAQNKDTKTRWPDLILYNGSAAHGAAARMSGCADDELSRYLNTYVRQDNLGGCVPQT
jgi:hypothetical protein